MMACGWAVNILQTSKGWDFVHACRVIFFAYAVIGALKFLLSISLSSKVEAEEKKAAPTQENETQPLLGEQNDTQQPQKKPLFPFLEDKALVSLVIRLFILFGLDSFASGLASLCVLR